MPTAKLVIKYIKHWLQSHNPKGFGIHSPFIFNLVTDIIHDYTPFYCYSDIENERIKLLNNHKIITVEDYGAGSKILKNAEKKIANIAKHSLKQKKHAQLLFRLINHFGSQQILEVGTSLGITASYMALVSSKSKVFTLEGCPEISKMARQTFNSLHIKNIELVTGKFDKTINSTLAQLKKVDFVFFDGNHKGRATLSYFNACLPFAHNNTIFVFDDIHYTDDMEKAWEQIKTDDRVKVTLDLFYMGIVFFKKELTKQHFKIRF